MSTSRDKTPVWGRPAPGSRRPRLTREQIAQKALAIADREGFEAVSMRRLAEELGTGTMSLYHYVRTKDELVALMDDALMGESLVDEKQLRGGWREGLATLARSTRTALGRHPWALLALQKAQLGPNAMRHFEQSLAAVAEAPLRPAEKLDLLATVDAYVFGSVLQTAEVRARAGEDAFDEEAIDAMIDFGLAQIRSGGFPHTVAMFGDADPRAPGKKPKVQIPRDAAEMEKQFERGLRTLLDGAALRMGRPGQKARRVR
jgi:AcrR family transcriptional regulator